MATKTILAQLAQIAKAKKGSDQEELSRMANSCLTDWENASDVCTKLTPLLLLDDLDDDGNALVDSQSDVDMLDSILASNQQIIINGEGTTYTFVAGQTTGEYPKVLTVTRDSNGSPVTTTLMEWGSAEASKIRMHAIPLFERTHIPSAYQKFSGFCGTLYALGNIARMAAQVSWDKASEMAGSLIQLINEYKPILVDYTEQLLSAIVAGPRALYHTISSLLSKVVAVEQQGDLSSLLSSTSITVNNFAWGGVATAIGQVMTMAAVALMAVSRIAAIVVAAVGAIVAGISRIVATATTSWENTRFKLYTGTDVPHCFSFVVSQGTTTNESLAKFMRARAWQTATILCPWNGSMLFIYLNNFDDPSDYQVTFEEHLTTDVDLTQVYATTSIQNSSTKYPIINLNRGTTRPGVVLSHVKPSEVTVGEDQGILLGFAVNKTYQGLEGTFPRFYPDWRAMCLGQAYSPIEFSIFDNLKQLFGDDVEDMLRVRLASAIIVWCADRLSELLPTGSALSETFRQTDMVGVYMTTLNYFQFGSTPMGAIYDLYEKAWLALVSNDGTYVTDNTRTNFGLGNSEMDALIQAIKSTFDGLHYTGITSIAIPYRTVRITYSGSSFQLSFVGTNKTLSISQQDTIKSNSYNMTLMRYAQDTYAELDEMASGTWPSKFAADLPTLTFSGFIAGLIVDGLIVLAVATAIVGVTIGYFKLKNSAVKYRAQAETAWGNYGKSGSQEDWAAYKAARRKANVYARITGGSTIGLNYWDTGDTSGLITGVIGRADSQIQTGVNSANSSIAALASDSATGFSDSIEAIGVVLHKITG